MGKIGWLQMMEHRFWSTAWLKTMSKGQCKVDLNSPGTPFWIFKSIRTYIECEHGEALQLQKIV
jgi:hypothetical protein